jgi:hypothetical protein
MASYFELQPHPKASGGKAAHYGMLSPQVTRILDDLEDHSDSDEENDPLESPSDGERVSSKEDKSQESPQKAKSSPLPAASPLARLPPPRPDLGKDRPPHFARFHSLRSMLFSSKIEDKLGQEDEPVRLGTEEKWKADHENRRASNKLANGGSQTKEGLIRRAGSKLKRMGSKDAPPMKIITEDDESSASDRGNNKVELGKKHDEQHVSDDESIHHSDIEDLVRWTSRRDPPSDGEVRKGRQKEKTGTKVDARDSIHESFGQGDVDELVRWVSKKNLPQGEETNLSHDYSDLSTEWDSDADEGPSRGTADEDNANELVQWISRRDRDHAGPVPRAKGINDPKEEYDTLVERREGDGKGMGVSIETKEHKASLAPEDVDELVEWVSKRQVGPNTHA